MRPHIRTVLHRAAAPGDCRFEPQGYPVETLGSSTLLPADADLVAHDFSNLATRWTDGVEVLVPASGADQPTLVLGLLAEAQHQREQGLRDGSDYGAVYQHNTWRVFGLANIHGSSER